MADLSAIFIIYAAINSIMPNIQVSSYKPVAFLPNGHFETIFPSLFRKVSPLAHRRHRIDTPDGDFLDFDWYAREKRKRVVIISHGLEGNSKKPYVLGMVRKFVSNGWDAIAWNYRGCSGEPNQTLRFYHSGATDDLAAVIQFAADAGYDIITLAGFSLGGNLTLKYLGENNGRFPEQIKAAVTFSVPLDLYGGCMEISKPANAIYARRFLLKLKAKVRDKARVMPALDPGPLKKIKTLYEFDNIYTAPLHGFADARDYYSKCSALNFLKHISVPTLIVNAKNDPILSAECYPTGLTEKLEVVWFETPERGGHVGFLSRNQAGFHYWSEQRALDFTEPFTGSVVD